MAQLASAGNSQSRSALPVWTWILPFPLIYGSAWLAPSFEVIQHATMLYLPIAIGIALVNWWGKRVLIAVFICDALAAPTVWGGSWLSAPLVGLTDLMAVGFSYLLYTATTRESPILASTQQVVRFLLLAVLIPCTTATIYTWLLLQELLHSEPPNLTEAMVFLWVADVLCVFLVTIPALVFLTRTMARLGWAINSDRPDPLTDGDMDANQSHTWRTVVMIINAAGILLVALLAPVEQYWFLYGIFPLTTALAFGFRLTVLTVAWVIFATVVLPVLIHNESNIGLGPCLSVLMLTTACLLTGRAISDRRQSEYLAEKHRHDVEQELEQVRVELVRQTKLAAIGQVSAGIAHEMRNPLGAIRNACYFLKTHTPESQDKWLEYISMIDREVATSDHIITNLLAMARKSPPNKKPVEFLNYATTSIKRYEHMPQMRFEVDCKPSDLAVEIDDGQFRHVLDNLILNGIQATDGQGNLSIQARPEEDGVRIEVSNDGYPINTEDRQHIFEPLFTTKAKGTGLGLAICRQIVEQHDGQIRLVDNPFKNRNGAQTVFAIWLPGDSRHP